MNIDNALRSLCFAELIGWRAGQLSYADACDEYRRLNETRTDIYVFLIRDGAVSIVDKPANFITVTSQRRPQLYLKLLQDVVTTYSLGIKTILAIGLGDACPGSFEAPIFTFQKPAGSSFVLLPDIDLLNSNFYIDPALNDDLQYDQKSTSAMFVGSTTGAGVTEEIVRTLALPRLRAAVYFRDNPRVRFLLPTIVQCDSERTEDLLRGMGVGTGTRISDKAQMSHKFIISMDGNGATCRRVALALKSNSVLLKYDSPHLLHYFRHLVPWQHYIPIGADDKVEGIVQMESDNPGLFRFIASEGRVFAERYLTKAAASQYTAELICFYAGLFSSDAVVALPSTMRADAPATAEPGADDSAPLVFVCEGHFENLGDDWAPGGEWLGRAGSNRWVEGFMLRGVPAGVSYQAISQDGTATDPAHDGEFCGTRGLHQPVYGFRINLDGDVAARLECHSFATFVDGSKVGPVPDGHNCQANTLAPLESMRIELRSCRMRDRPATLSVSAFPDPQPGQHEAQVPHREAEPHPTAAAAGVLRRMTIDGFVRVSPLRGTPYLNFLKELHVKRRVSRYLEIGTNSGNSLGLATGRSVAIDPGFQLDKAAWAAKPGINLFEMTSDDFFATTDPRDALGGTVELAFIDGMHLAEFVLRDFSNVERFCTRDSLIVLHDALPQNFEMTERDHRPTQRQDKACFGAWTGDVWRVVPLLRRERPDLRIDVLDCQPTGLVLVGNLDPQNQTLPNRLDQLTRELTDCDPPEAEFWSYIESLAVIDSSALPRQAAG